MVSISAGTLLAGTTGPTGPARGSGRRIPGQKESEMTFLKRAKGRVGKASNQVDQQCSGLKVRDPWLVGAAPGISEHWGRDRGEEWRGRSAEKEESYVCRRRSSGSILGVVEGQERYESGIDVTCRISLSTGLEDGQGREPSCSARRQRMAWRAMEEQS